MQVLFDENVFYTRIIQSERIWKIFFTLSLFSPYCWLWNGKLRPELLFRWEWKHTFQIAKCCHFIYFETLYMLLLVDLANLQSFAFERGKQSHMFVRSATFIWQKCSAAGTTHALLSKIQNTKYKIPRQKCSAAGTTNAIPSHPSSDKDLTSHCIALMPLVIKVI